MYEGVGIIGKEFLLKFCGINLHDHWKLWVLNLRTSNEINIRWFVQLYPTILSESYCYFPNLELGVVRSFHQCVLQPSSAIVTLSWITFKFNRWWVFGRYCWSSKFHVYLAQKDCIWWSSNLQWTHHISFSHARKVFGWNFK